MKKINNNAVGVCRGSELMFSSYDNDGEMWSGQGSRFIVRRVTFPTPFLTSPIVHVSISMWDIARDSNQRAHIEAADVAPDGFDLVFRTWSDTRVARIRADWLAIGELDYDDDWDLT
ncbi:H-type lectin domain-containing protein [Paracoccus pacificus]|uniref:H-type lectin domain-containing protein n=1 Tax=Paracoccus pacificus TaxID=1463598 RepID=A0ABW4RAK0_9RHOB